MSIGLRGVPGRNGLRQRRQAGSDSGHAVERIDADGRGDRARASAWHVPRGRRLGVVRVGCAQPQGRDPESLRMVEGPAPGHQRRHRAAVPQRRTVPGAGPEHPAQQPGESQRGLWVLRAGHVDDATDHAEPGHPVRLLQLGGAGDVGSRGPIRPRAHLRGDQEHAELEGCVASFRRRLRRLRQRQDRNQGQHRPVPAVGRHRIRQYLQSADLRDRPAYVDRHQPRRHRAGERARTDQ